ncbi:lipoprotein LpqH [Actinomyces qiguomingii]|uniref:lipoprotein LpqH n=1 Tax=Actinomyces qiguomingii TaxID=2057800 RepID=UPI000CA0466A|nr:lipoprotein LpqH [Actinomyces qiguomingii]
MKTSIVKAATTTVALVLGFGISACGSSSSNDAEESSAGSATAETDSAISADDVKVGGSFSGTLNGEPFEIDDVGVACLSGDGQTSIGVAPVDALLTDTDVSSVSLVIDEASNDVTLITIVPAGGTTLNYTNIGGYSSGVGSAQVEVNDSTYTVTGEAAPSGSTETETQAFNFVITCPSPES